MPSRHPRSSSWAQGLSLEQFLEECVRRRQCGELSQAEIELIFTVLYPIARYNRERLNPKWSQALELIRHKPQDWFREQPIDDRDRALLNARPMSCFDLGKKSFLKKMVSPKASCLITEEPEEAEPPSLQLTSFQSHKVVDEEFKITVWDVENEEQCRRMIRQGGSHFIGFSTQPPADEHRPEWHSMKVDVQVSGNIAPHIQWSMLCTMPSKTRVLAGPHSTCPNHPWDAMILRDCYSGTDRMFGIPRYGTRFFDVLLMKMCEDYDHPWVMVAVKDSGPYVSHGSCYGL